MAQPGSAKSKDSLSRNRLRLVLCTLRVILNHAEEDSEIEKNPARKLGRFTKIDGSQQKKATALSREEAEQFLASAEQICPQHYPLFLTALRAGLRRGELIALQWGDIQFGTSEHDPNRYILVQHNWVNGSLISPKSRKPRRVDMSRQPRAVLLALRDQHLLEAFSNGKRASPVTWSFPPKLGLLCSPRTSCPPLLPAHLGTRRPKTHPPS